jgi:hypothetical protein
MSSRFLWSRKLGGGAEVACLLRYEGGCAATVTLTVAAAQAEDVTAVALAERLRELLDTQGATVLPERMAVVGGGEHGGPSSGAEL